jgi:SAM-dependent methyltransferase
MEQHDEKLEKSREYWDMRSSSFGKDGGRNHYADEFIAKLGLREGQSVFDMGCATGTLAMPLARAGHEVAACDFSPKMLSRLDQTVEQEGLPITTTLMAWQDDWDDFGFGSDSVDVAIASRSIPFEDVAGPLGKLEHIAREKVALTVPASPAPAFDFRLMEHLGRKVPASRLDVTVIQVLADMGRYPESSYIICERPMRFDSLEYAKSELLRMAGVEPLEKKESTLFEEYAAEHFKATRLDDKTVYTLDYRLMVHWAFISWAKEI